ncbi:MAG: FAD:protein FMN transferase [Leptospira sp.]|nr:FAD:protein FMN transferase [Leptospira sp.]
MNLFNYFKISFDFFFIVTIIIVLSIFPSCKKQYHSIHGSTMGTTYTISSDTELKAHYSKLDNELGRIENVFSTYKKDSEISQINQSISQNRSYTMSSEMQDLLDLSKQIGMESGGAFSAELGDLVKSWGFGKYSGKYDLSGIAKGYGVDRLAIMLQDLGVNEYMIEIGGEVCTSINPGSSKKWKIGIPNPTDPSRLFRVLYLREGCIATSGNNQQSIVKDGKKYTHIIDPRIGIPIERESSSVTVYLDKNIENGIVFHGAWVDAWATAFYVLGVEVGIQMANEKGIAVLYVYENNETVVQEYSDEWKKKFEK